MAERNQQFDSHAQWVNSAQSWLTRRGEFVKAVCFDTEGRACQNGGDMKRAHDEGAFPVRWLWPDQIAAMAVRPTPAARWREEGEADPHGDRYACERAQTFMGDKTDDELANAVFLYDHRNGLESMALLTAAKDRIRWLSRQLEKLKGPKDA